MSSLGRRENGYGRHNDRAREERGFMDRPRDRGRERDDWDRPRDRGREREDWDRPRDRGRQSDRDRRASPDRGSRWPQESRHGADFSWGGTGSRGGHDGGASGGSGGCHGPTSDTRRGSGSWASSTVPRGGRFARTSSVGEDVAHSHQQSRGRGDSGDRHSRGGAGGVGATGRQDGFAPSSTAPLAHRPERSRADRSRYDGPPDHSQRLDWICDKCGTNNFARRIECFTCKAPKGVGAFSVPAHGSDVGSMLVSPSPTNAVIVRDLSGTSTDQSVMSTLKAYAPIKDCRVVRDAASGVSLRVCFAEFLNVEHAEHTVSAATQAVLRVDGAPLRVAFARNIRTPNQQTGLTVAVLESLYLSLRSAAVAAAAASLPGAAAGAWGVVGPPEAGVTVTVTDHLQDVLGRARASLLGGGGGGVGGGSAGEARPLDGPLASWDVDRDRAPSPEERSGGKVDAAVIAAAVAKKMGPPGWPPSFEEAGAAYIFDARTGYFYESSSGVYYDPKSKLYCKDMRWYQHTPGHDPPYVAIDEGQQQGLGVSAAATAQDGQGSAVAGIAQSATPATGVLSSCREERSEGGLQGEAPVLEATQDSTLAPATAPAKVLKRSGPGGMSKPVSFGLKGGLRQPKAGAGSADGRKGSIGAGSSNISSSSMAGGGSVLLQKRHAKDMSKWANRQREDEADLHTLPKAPRTTAVAVAPSPHARPAESPKHTGPGATLPAGTADSRWDGGVPPWAPSAPELVDRAPATPGPIACLLCRRAFASQEQLAKHEAKSKLHQENLAAARGRPAPAASTSAV